MTPNTRRLTKLDKDTTVKLTDDQQRYIASTLKLCGQAGFTVRQSDLIRLGLSLACAEYERRARLVIDSLM